MRLNTFLLLAMSLLPAQAFAGFIPVCSTTETEQVAFIQARVETMPPAEELRRSEQWVMTIRRNPERSAADLASYCAKHPDLSLAFAFKELFDAD